MIFRTQRVESNILLTLTSPVCFPPPPHAAPRKCACVCGLHAAHAFVVSGTAGGFSRFLRASHTTKIASPMLLLQMVTDFGGGKALHTACHHVFMGVFTWLVSDFLSGPPVLFTCFSP